MKKLYPFRSPAYVVLLKFRPYITKLDLTNYMVSRVNTVVKHGGIVQTLRNHGVGPTPKPVKYQAEKFNELRLVSMSIYCDASKLRDIVQDLTYRDDTLLHYVVRKEYKPPL